MPDNPCPLCLRTGEHHPGCPAANPPVPDPPPTRWAKLELMGHRTLAGRVSEEAHFGGVLGRIDCPRPDGTFVTVLFRSESVYQLTYLSEAAARVVADHFPPEPVHEYDLPQKVRDAMRAAERQVRPALAAAPDDVPFETGPYPTKPAYHGDAGVTTDAETDEDLEPGDEDLDDADDIRC